MSSIEKTHINKYLNNEISRIELQTPVTRHMVLSFLSLNNSRLRHYTRIVLHNAITDLSVEDLKDILNHNESSKFYTFKVAANAIVHGISFQQDLDNYQALDLIRTRVIFDYISKAQHYEFKDITYEYEDDSDDEDYEPFMQFRDADTGSYISEEEVINLDESINGTSP